MNGPGTGGSVAPGGGAPHGVVTGDPSGGDGGGGALANRDPGGAAPSGPADGTVAPQLPQYRSPWMIGASQLGQFAISLPRRASRGT